MGSDRLADQRVISTTNRNFEGRQGPKTTTHLASPALVASSELVQRLTGRSRHGPVTLCALQARSSK
jgi:homoaconitase/3-isopropylmalate dehydratase large subunit